MRIFFCFTFTLIVMISAAQVAPDKYWVQFTDKNNNPYSITNPEQYLTQRALERRQKQGVKIDVKDIPVTPGYIDSLQAMGLKILTCSKWFNAVTVYSTDTALIDTITNLSFVSQIYKVRKYKKANSTNESFYEQSLKVNSNIGKVESVKSLLKYGQAETQITMLNGQILHNNGFMGQGMQIAVIDGGFLNTNSVPAFDSLWMNNQILGTKDFVSDSTDIFSQHGHGTRVLSIMAGNIPGELVGTAPKAEYYLLRSEDTNSEYMVEEDNWVAAAEYADSLGVDIINVSLGYETYDDPNQSYTYNNMDGNTARISVGADIAASKGMLVVVSAGNSGDKPWHFIGAPADADSVLTVGAVDSNRAYANFSSVGPTADGRIKPDVVAMGASTVQQTPFGSIWVGNGTSFSSPIIAGMAACLWQANPTLTNMEVIEFIKKSASRSKTPDNMMGYGIPDFAYANYLIQGIDYADLDSENYIVTYPNPFTDEVCIELYSVDSQQVTIEVFDVTGKLAISKKVDLAMTSYNKIVLSEVSELQVGNYIIQITTETKNYKDKIVKQ